VKWREVTWRDVQTELTTHLPWRKLRLVHLPTGIVVEAEGTHVSTRRLKKLLWPKLCEAVNPKPPIPEPGPFPTDDGKARDTKGVPR